MPENNLPSYEELFGNLDYSTADEYRSVLSPAAYLTDIMDLKNWNYDRDGEDKPDAVDDRREDISEIPLNKDNTITEIPHLDVVNRIMENRVVASNPGTDPYLSLKGAKFPLNLPFNRDKTEIGHLLGYFKTTPLSFYRAFTPAPEITVSARESLGLSEEEYQLFITPITKQADLKEAYGFIGSETFDDLTKLKRFRKATDLPAIQVLELFYQNLSFEEQDSGVSKRFFINHSTDTDGYLVTGIDETTEEERIYVHRQTGGGATEDIAPPLDYLERT